MSAVTINPTIQNNPYMESVRKYLASQGIDMNSPQGQAAAQQVAASGGMGSAASLPLMIAGKYGMAKLMAPASTAATTASTGAGAADLGLSSVPAFNPSIPASFGSSAAAPSYSLGVSNIGETAPMTSAAAPTTEAASTLGSVAPYLGLAGAGLGAYGMYKGIGVGSRKASAMGGAALGGGLAAAAPLLLGTGPLGWGALALATLGGGALGGALGHIKTGKSMVQQERDSSRDVLQNAFHLDKNNYTLNGFDFGQDGKHMLKSADGTMRHAYDVDMSDPLAVSNISKLSPIVSALMQGAGERQQTQTVGMLMNALMSKAKTQQDFDTAFKSTLGGLNIPGAPSVSAAPPRSRTRSPGISKSGKAISYGK